jgi:GNAT superfamily N-acetyltransferase
VLFRHYSSDDSEACLAIFDANSPAYFAPNERADYERFLDQAPEGYEVCELAGRVVAAFGLINNGDKGQSLNWIMLDPQSQGAGIGSAIMRRIISLGKASGLPMISIAASQKSAPFFARFGAVASARTEGGWGPGLHRVDMELYL